MATRRHTLVVDSHEVSISNPDKVLFPDGKVTKSQVVQYYLRMSTWVLPHLKDRPVTLKRYPDGALGDFFYEKNAPKFTPDWVQTFPVERQKSGGTIHYILINDRATLVWLANLANLELHPFLHRVPKIDRPTSIVFDLDPGEGADVLACARVAFMLRDLLGKFELRLFPKVSGSKGLQVYVPLNTAVTYGVTAPFAKAIADLMEEQHPDLIVSDMKKALRVKKVFIDWSQNNISKTTAGVYSLRAATGEPFVSMPVTWEELESAVAKGKPADLYFGMDAALARVSEIGDLFNPMLSIKQKLPAKLLKEFRPAA
jgi:bifunctional non-homologous end joining protein LigD